MIAALIAFTCIFGWLTGTVWTTRQMMTREYEDDVRTYKVVEPDNAMLAPTLLLALVCWPVIAVWYVAEPALKGVLNPKLAAFEQAKRDAEDFRAKAAQLRSDATVIGGDVGRDLRVLAEQYDAMAIEKRRVR